eukprot:CAMPEP_0113620898 /NCGR_PEP_ID=MMETSP0017_2-20120614/10660_1 /TAXON_ID=2856 /ORGANISM="Cylindrotheca closterium" /LENGTH=566 /DNA_ID=CAMNT_0000530593 /DNA_START=192 /DNA_END=1892 /DNA_ORIENTATION=- /assembly_acc=CAM_ASM_000147
MLGRLSTRRLPVYAQAWTTGVSSVVRYQRRQGNHLTTTRLFQQASTTKTKSTSTRNPNANTVVTNQKSSNSNNSNNNNNNEKIINLHTIPLEELEEVIVSLGHPKYRAKQVYNWVRVQGVTDVSQMNNIPKKLKADLERFAAVGSLTLDMEQISKDGTKKRAYRLEDGQLIESVLMPYTDGRYTACISSQAGCAQGCVFCATGQMGFSRQLTSDEIFEQVARFASELSQQDQQEKKELKIKNSKNGKGETQEHYSRNQQQKTSGRSTRLSNLVFMGMGEPLANYRNVKKAIQRIQSELGIGHRKITVSTVGIVPNIYKMAEELPQVRLAVSLHCANDDERSDLLPANKRNGGLKELMTALQDYISTTGKRVTLEWALIEGENDTPETAHELGKLIKKWLRKDMVHINVIPLNPTGGYGGSPSGRQRVNAFCAILEDRYGVACTPRVRRGIDINAGCGQLKAEVEKQQRESKLAQEEVNTQATQAEEPELMTDETNLVDDSIEVEQDLQFALDELAIEISDEEDWEDYEYQSEDELAEVNRLIDLVKGTTITAENQVVGQPDAAATP